MAKVLVLVNPATLQILSTKDYLLSFELFSKHDISYLPEVPPAWTVGGQVSKRTERDYLEILASYDVVVISQHLRLCFDGWINGNLYNALLAFRGMKIVFLHDEYDHTEKTREWIEHQKVDLVYTVVPEKHVAKVYDPSRFSSTRFRSILTGYMPLKFSQRNGSLPIAERQNLIVYRGRVSPESYGELAKQKETIGRYFDNYCQTHKIKSDIQWEEAERVYGLDWYRLLETGVATLGTESGSNVFDEFGLIRDHVAAGKSLPGPPELNFVEENLGFKMNQISARLFEAIGCGTALVLYEGNYSGVIEPYKHFLPVKHDHSNVADVIDQLNDSVLVQKLVDNAWAHVSSSKELKFQHLIELFDQDVEQFKSTAKARSSETVAFNGGQHLLVGEFSDISATGIGVFSELYGKASSMPRNFNRLLKLKKWLTTKLRNYPRILRLLKRLYRVLTPILERLSIGLSRLRLHGYLGLRKAYRSIPNRFPVLGRLKRKLLSK